MKKKKGLKACSSKSIDRDALEAYVLKQLSMKIFDDGAANEIAQYYSEYCGKADKEYREKIKELNNELLKYDKEINNVVDLLLTTKSSALIERLETLEAKKEEAKEKIAMQEVKVNSSVITKKDILEAFSYGRKLIKDKTMPNLKKLVQLFVDKIVIMPNHIYIQFNFAPQKRKSASDEAFWNKKNLCALNDAHRNGGEGETRTLAPVTRPTPLAGAPRHQLEYFSMVTKQAI